MIQEPNIEHKWSIKPKSRLDKFVKKRGKYTDIHISEWGVDVFNRDIITISVSYIKCVKLIDIEIEETWSETKRREIKKWATQNNLCLSEPRVEKEYKHNGDNRGKYKIVDGIHRINRAKELGMKCIRVKVYERVKIDKTDTKNITLNSNQSIQ